MASARCRALRARGPHLLAFGAGAGALLILLAAPARAEQRAPEEAAAPPPDGSAAAGNDAALSDALGNAAGSDDALQLSSPPDDGIDPDDARTLEPSDYYLGLRYRGLVIPEFVLDWFINGAQTIYANGIGPEFSIRDGSAEYTLSAWVAFYAMDPSAIKGLQNEEEAWEIIESDLKSLYLTADFLWHHPLRPGLDLSYGASAGIGFIFGDLYRTQAYLTEGGTPGDPSDYRPCHALGQPSDIYCDDYNDHYGGFSEPSWSNGGAKPVLFPWLAGQLGLRYQAHPRVVTRLDIGLGLSGILLGLAADYGL